MATEAQTETHKETLPFQAEAKQVLDLMTHSLYSNKEVFLRELISNASDAADRLRFLALTDDALYENDSDLSVSVQFDKEARTITVSDNGIGMNREDVLENIGTIAKSGTRSFLEALSGDQARDAHMIGQFGVGFYSAFIVADKITLTTRRAGLTQEHGVRWVSDGAGEFSIETVEKSERGTKIILHLKESEDEFLNEHRLQEVIHKYSDHIPFPIKMQSEEGKLETINKASALWTRSRDEISKEEYEAFYKHVAHDFQEPLTYVHSRLEGNLEYTLLLYIPKMAPFDMWDRDSQSGLKLYVQRVYIMDAGEALIPRYLRFVRGILDSSDLPLNVSREILQHDRLMGAMKKGAVKKVLGMLEDLAKDKDGYKTFWNQFGRVFKEGVIEDDVNRKRIATLLRFASTHQDGDEQGVSLADYIERMPEGQDKIYYITAENIATARQSPHVEVFHKKGIEVLLLSDRVDEWMVDYLKEFEGKSLVSVTKGDLELGDLVDEEERKKHEDAAGALKGLDDTIGKALQDKIKEVRFSHRLTDSPACLVAESGELSTHLERMFKEMGQSAPERKLIMEINPEHILIKRLQKEESEEVMADWANLLFDQAALAEGGHLEDPAGFVNRLNRMLSK
ncbi:MAG: molecular chaperone HtpG [Mariprofundaceae bacterium]